MKKLYTLMLMLGMFLIPQITTYGYDIPLNYGVSDNNEAFVQTRNLFDFTNLELGGIDRNTGEKYSDTRAIRSIAKKPILPSTNYTFSLLIGTTDNVIFYYYDLNDVFLGRALRSLTGPSSGTFTTPASAATYHIALFNISAPAPSFNNNYQLELGPNETSYSPYGFLSLNDIFVDGNKIDNNNWIGNANTDVSIHNSEITGIGNGTGSELRISQNISILATNSVYINYNYKTNVLGATVYQGRYVLGGTASFFSTFTYDFSQYKNGSNKYTTAGNITRIDFIVQKSNILISEFIMFNNIYVIDLNTLGIDNLTINQLDSLYYDFQINNIYDQGFTDGQESTDAYAFGFDTGYNDGYGDAVQEDNAYSLGYALGLSEGQDMETGSSIIVLVLGLMAFVMMLFGFTSRRRIFNLFASGLFIVLGGILVEYAAFVIVAVGLVIVNVYYTFVSE